MKKRILSILLSLVMVMSLLPTTVFAAASSIYVGGVKVPNGYYLGVDKTTASTKKPSGGYAYYKDGVLTLHNYEFQGKGYTFSTKKTAAIYCKGDLTVKLEGENIVVNNYANDYHRGVAGYGIYTTGNLTMEGGEEDVLLTLATDACIWTEKGITANGGGYVLKRSGDFPDWGYRAEGGAISLNNCAVVSSGLQGPALCAQDNITVTDSVVLAEDTYGLLWSFDGDITVSGSYIEAYVVNYVVGSSTAGSTFYVSDYAEIYAERKNNSGLFNGNVDYIVMDDTVRGYRLDPNRDTAEYLNDSKLPGCKVIHIAPDLHYHLNDGTITHDDVGHSVTCSDPECPVAVDGVVYEEHIYLTAAAIECAVCGYNRTYEGVFIGDVHLTDGDYLAVDGTEPVAQQPDGGYAHYDNGVLTLHDFRYNGYGAEYKAGEAAAGVFAMEDLHIVLEGDNSITVQTYEDLLYCHGVYLYYNAKPALKMSGDGSLTVSAVDNAVYAGGGLTLDGVTLTVEQGSVKGDDGQISITDSVLDLTEEIFANTTTAEVVIRNSTLTAADIVASNPVDMENTVLTLTDAQPILHGISQTAVYKRLENCDVTSNYTVEVTEGVVNNSKITLDIVAQGEGLVLQGEAASITNSDIVVKCVGSGIRSAGDLTIKNSQIVAEGRLYGLECKNTLTVENSNLLLLSTLSTSTNSYYALKTEGLTLVNENDEMTAATGLKDAFTAYQAAENDSYAIVRITPEGGGFKRIYGSDRAKTALAAAEEMKALLGVEKFSAVVLASGTNFADALAGSCLAAVKSAPILLYTEGTVQNTIAYIGNNLDLENGVVYLLGGTGAVPESVVTDLEAAGVTVQRLYGDSRFTTNLEILRAAEVTAEQEILVCTGYNFADSLAASATGLPILLVNSKKDALDGQQKTYLEELAAGGSLKLTIIGGTGAVGEGLAAELASYGTVDRVYGDSRYTTAVAIAERYFSDFDKACIAYGQNFPDGLCGGPLAYMSGAPLLLVRDGKESIPADFLREHSVTKGYVLGGTSVVSDFSAARVFH